MGVQYTKRKKLEKVKKSESLATLIFYKTLQNKKIFFQSKGEGPIVYGGNLIMHGTPEFYLINEKQEIKNSKKWVQIEIYIFDYFGESPFFTKEKQDSYENIFVYIYILVVLFVFVIEKVIRQAL